MKKFTSDEILKIYISKNYPLNNSIMGMNIFGVRNKDVNADTFDDTVGVVWKDTKGVVNIMNWDATTDPGMYYRLNPMNKDGTAIIIPGYHKDCYKVGLHNGYEAMQQIAPMAYVRDNNKNGVLDFLYKTTGFKVFMQLGATNIHHAGANSKVNYNWSAGCQVFANLADFLVFMNIIKSSLNSGKNVFSYTLFEIEDFK